MTIQPDYVKEELLHELGESFCMHNQLPPDLFTRYRIKRGLRNADGTGVLVGASHLGNVHGYILNEGASASRSKAALTYRGYNVYDLIHGLEQENRFGFGEIGYLLMCGKLPSRRQLAEFPAHHRSGACPAGQLHRGYDHACAEPRHHEQAGKRNAGTVFL